MAYLKIKANQPSLTSSLSKNSSQSITSYQ